MAWAIGAAIAVPWLAWSGEAPAPRPTPPRPPVVRPTPLYRDELPEGPETPADQLPASYYAALGQVYLQFHQWTKAEEALLTAYEKEQDPLRRAQAAYDLARLHVRNQAHDKALPLLKEAAALKPGTAQSYATSRFKRALIGLYEKMGKPQEAAALYRQVIEGAATPHERDFARREYFQFCKRVGTLEAEVEKLEAALADEPNDETALRGLQMIYAYIEPNPDKALAISERLVAVTPADRTATLRLAAAYQRGRNYEKAIDLLEKFLAANPDEARYLESQLTHLYVTAGQKDKAVKWAEDLLAKDPDSLATRTRVASLYERLNLADEALAQYEAAVKMATRDSERDRYMLAAAHLARRVKKYDQAEALARQLAKSRSKTTVAQANALLVEIYKDQGKLDQLKIETRPQE
jgi:tetratricopeptide (TPR) repeat protein